MLSTKLFVVYMEVAVAKQFSPILVPNYCGARFSFRHTKKDNFVSQHIFIVKVRSLRYLCTLSRKKHLKIFVKGN